MDKKTFKFCLYVGDISVDLATTAQSHDRSAFLINCANYQQVLDHALTKNITAYTSLGDLPKNLDVFLDLCGQADEVVYCPPKQWSDGRTVNDFCPEESIQGLTETLLTMVTDRTKVVGLNVESTVHPIPLVDNRKTDSKQLWVAGCSISHGVGVTADQRFGSLLSMDLDMPCSFLTRPGSSIDWASDQICRSDIQNGDTVIFGLTSGCRMTFVHNHKLLSGITANTYSQYPEYQQIIPEYNLLTENTFYHQTLAIERCINFCRKINAKLLLIGLLISQSANLLRYICQKENFFLYPYQFSHSNQFTIKFKDLGSDHQHPGSQQHSLYRDFIIKHIS